MSKLFYCSFTLLLWLGAFSISYAQISVGLKANLGIPFLSMDEYTNPQVGYGIETHFSINDKISAGLALDWYRFQLDVSSLDLDVDFPIDLERLLRETPVRFKVVPLVAGFRYMLAGERIRPYTGVEIGLHYVAVRALGLKISHHFWGIAPVFGGIVPITDQFSLFANAKLQVVWANETIPLIGQELNGHLVFIPFQAGFFFHFFK